MKELETVMSRLRSTAIQKDKESTSGKILSGSVVNVEFENLLDTACKLLDEVHRLKADYKSFRNTVSQGSLRKLFALPSSLRTKHRLSRRALSLVEKMADLRKELRGEGLLKIDMFCDIQGRTVERRDKVMGKWVDQLWNYWTMGHGKGKLFCVHGMGGVGKTRLLEELYEKFLGEGHDMRVFMFEVREQMNWKIIQRDIARKLVLGWETENEEALAARIADALKEKCEYVFLFDDVWEELPLSSIGFPSDENTGGTIPRSCMVVFSTRIFSLCRGEKHSTVSLKCLPDDESWLLFRENAGRSSELIETNPKIRILARQIVEECGGLPLALVNVGKSFSNVSTVADWKKGVHDMKREPWKIHHMEGYVLDVLRRSYANLSSDRLRICFTYFVLMHSIKMDRDPLLWFTFYWIGERIIEHWTDLEDAHNRRDQLMEELEDVGLVIPGNPPIMHKMVRAMAVWLGIAGERYIAMPRMGLVDAQAGGTISWNNARRISLLNNRIACGWPEEPNCPELLTLLIWQDVPNRALPSGFFLRMCSLKVLNLCILEELPPSIGELHLLEFLNMSWSKIKLLPMEIGKLARLRYLNLNWSSNLVVVPCAIFGKLTKLEFLGLEDTYSKWGVDADGATIQELSGLEHLKYLSITIDNITALEALLVASTHLQSVVRYIILRQLNGVRSIQLLRGVGKDMKQLKRMQISNCMDLKEIVFEQSNTDGSMENLYELDLFYLSQVTIMFKGVGSTNENNDRCFLRNLGILKISNCIKLQELVEDGCEGYFTFPNLKELHLGYLREMRSICRAPLKFPSMMILHVVDCPKLRKLPFRGESGRMLSEIKGSKSWWDNLDWGDGGQHLKSRFDRFFQQVS